MGTLADALNSRRVGGRQTGVQVASPPVVEGIAPRRAADRSGERERRKPQAARSSSPAAASASPAPPPRRALSDRELYQKWLQLSLTPDTPAIVEWPYVYLSARA